MVQPDSISGSLPELRLQPPVRLGVAERELVLGRLRLGTWIIWGAGFTVATILFLLAAPPDRKSVV